jgi:hypothetical protein
VGEIEHVFDNGRFAASIDGAEGDGDGEFLVADGAGGHPDAVAPGTLDVWGADESVAWEFAEDDEGVVFQVAASGEGLLEVVTLLGDFASGATFLQGEVGMFGDRGGDRAFGGLLVLEEVGGGEVEDGGDVVEATGGIFFGEEIFDFDVRADEVAQGFFVLGGVEATEGRSAFGLLLGEGTLVEGTAEGFERGGSSGFRGLVCLCGGHFTRLDAVVDFDPGGEGDFAIEAKFPLLQIGAVTLDAVGVEEWAQFGGEGEAEGLDEEPDEGETEHAWGKRADTLPLRLEQVSGAS